MGFGVTAAEQNYDNYAGIDAKGKIVAFVSGAPPQFEPMMREKPAWNPGDFFGEHYAKKAN